MHPDQDDDDIIDLTTPPPKHPARSRAAAAPLDDAVVVVPWTPDSETRGSGSGADGKKPKRSLSLSPSFGVRLRCTSRKRRLHTARKQQQDEDVIDLCDSEGEEGRGRLESEGEEPAAEPPSPASVCSDGAESGEEAEAEASVAAEEDEEEEEDGQEEDLSSQVEELSKLKADELRQRLRAMGLPPGSRKKMDMATTLLHAMRAQRLASFPTQSTDRFSDKRGRCVSGRAVVADLPRGPNGWVLCRVCQVEVKPPLLTFCSKACVHEHRLRTSGTYVRKCLRVRDKGVCALCKLQTEPLYLEASKLCRAKGVTGSDAAKVSMEEMQCRVDRVLAGTRLEGKVKLRRMKKGGRRVVSRGLFWHADHIVAVCEGGGLQGLDNFRTLCIACHQDVTNELRQRRGAGGKQKKKGAGRKKKAEEQASEAGGGADEDEEEEEEDSGSMASSSQSSATDGPAAAVASSGKARASLVVIDEEEEEEEGGRGGDSEDEDHGDEWLDVWSDGER